MDPFHPANDKARAQGKPHDESSHSMRCAATLAFGLDFRTARKRVKFFDYSLARLIIM